MSLDQPGFERFIRDFSPGFQDVPEENTLADGATPDARNGWYVKRNAGGRYRAKLAKRPGERLVNPTATVAATKVDSLFEFRRSGAARQLVKIIDGGAYVFNGVDTFIQVGATTPFTPGRSIAPEFYRDNAFLCDGTAMQRYDGATLFDVGQVAPTAVTNMTAQAPVTAGVTGTFEAEYFWYDPVMDHEAGPSAVTATLATVAQSRRHTQPTGVPAVQYTQWRAYVRRVDTNETLFFRVGTWNIGSGTHDEDVIDAARRDPAPLAGDNDPPPAPFSILVEWKGYFLGVIGSDIVVSKLGDAQSYPSNFRFSVRKGDGEEITGLKKFGEDLFIQKPHQTWRWVGDRPPFLLRDVHPSYGGVSQHSGLQVDGQLFDWDRERGPYVTDGLNWQSLGQGLIQTTLSQVNRDALGDIRCIHREDANLVGWAVPIGATSRKRVILWYDYLLKTWLPPWTGLEWGALATYTNAAGVTGTYVGDYWGRVFEMFSGDRDGVIDTALTTDLTATVTAGTVNDVTCAGANFPIGGDGLAGLRVAAISPGGNWQWRRILSNTVDTITLDVVEDAPFDTAPEAGWTVRLGGIEFYYLTPTWDEDQPHRKKKFYFLYLQGRATSPNHVLNIRPRYNDDTAVVSTTTVGIPVGPNAAVWGSGVWGLSLWGTTARKMAKKRIEDSAFGVQYQLWNYEPDQPMTITLFGISGDVTETQIESAS